MSLQVSEFAGSVAKTGTTIPERPETVDHDFVMALF
jgi:hypothetical protein